MSNNKRARAQPKPVMPPRNIERRPHYPTLDIRNQVFRLMKHFGVLQNARKAAIDLVQTAKKPI
jgi:hypothetical protein